MTRFKVGSSKLKKEIKKVVADIVFVSQTPSLKLSTFEKRATGSLVSNLSEPRVNNILSNVFGSNLLAIYHRVVHIFFVKFPTSI